jgi:exonuclease SbcC
MILAAVEIENYKQYAGTQRIEFPASGSIAITGPNGAGKTTLFEAIEWCLYGPLSIPRQDVPPRDGAGKTIVRVTLEDPIDGCRYVVQRALRNAAAAADAEVYREDQPDRTLVRGPREVTRYVAQQLIGLDHSAFVSTFFTRQRELTFFGNRDRSARRREVARLLGFDVIRHAQVDIAEERNKARTDADWLSKQYQAGVEGRDFAAEIGAAEVAVAVAREEDSGCQARLKETEDAYGAARENLDRWSELQAQDTVLDRELLGINAATELAESRRQGAASELGRLDRLSVERVSLAAQAERIENLTTAVEAFETERDRAVRLANLNKTRQASEAQLLSTAAALEGLVVSHHDAALGVGLADWPWTERDRADPCQAASRLHAVVSSVDHRHARMRADLLVKASVTSQRMHEASQKLAKFESLRQNLARQHALLIRRGHPGELLLAAETEAKAAQSALEQALTALTAAQRERQESEELERIFDERSFERRCPTCTRPISDDEAARLLHALRGATAQLRKLESAASDDCAAARDRVGTCDAAVKRANDCLKEVETLGHRLHDGAERIAELESELAREAADLESTLAAAQLVAVPEPLDVQQAADYAERAALLASLAGTIEQLAERAREARDVIQTADQEIAELGVVAYDAAAHRAAANDLERARAAAAEIKRIDIELATRDDYEAIRQNAERELVELDVRRQSVISERERVGFSDDSLRAARDAEARMRGDVERTREQREAAREALRATESALQQVVRERDRLEKIAADADRRTREADELTRMYEEFSAFDRFVAEQIGPLLAETTEFLLREVTESKYDRVYFDEDYGIHVFDGDQSFPLEGYSGGERDVVALCARLAMSQLIGSAAVRPPRFLVLDEVFGSLDSERRAQLLGTLGALASSGHFQQMFIISHVDDVQQSPVMNEAWTIEERDGVSRVVRPEVLIAAPA